MTDQVAGRDPNSYEFRLYFDGRSRSEVRAAALIHALDAWNQIELMETHFQRPGKAPADAATESGITLLGAYQSSRIAGAEPSGLLLVSPTGEAYGGYELFRRLTQALRLLWPLALLAWIPGASLLGRTYFPGQVHHASPSNEPQKNVDRIGAESS